jgi:hypothetical protein
MLVSWLAFLVFWTCANRFDDPDLWWHLKLGETMWTSHQIPSVDQFSFTANGSSWLAHEWLSQLLIYGVYQAGGFVGLHIAFSLLATLIVSLTYLLSSLWSGNWKASLLGGIGSLLFLTVSLSIRPLLIGHLFLVVELLLLYVGLVRGKQAWLFALPPLFVIWANAHGSFLFGLVFLAATMAGQCLRIEGWRPRLHGDLKRVGLIATLCLLAPLINPVGPALAVYPIDVLLFQPDNTGSVVEWAPLNLLESRGLWLVGVLGFVFTMAIALRKRLLPAEWIALLFSAMMALQHVRMLPIFGFIACPIVCRIVAPYWDRYDPQRDRKGINAAMICVAAFLCFLVLPTQQQLEAQVSSHEPAAAVAWMQQNSLPGPVLNEYVFGGFLMWANPKEPVFIDGRTDIYAWNGVLRDYGRWALLQDDPKLLLDRYKIQTCLLSTAAPIARVMPYLPGWKQVYKDDLAVLFTRSN